MEHIEEKVEGPVDPNQETVTAEAAAASDAGSNGVVAAAADEGKLQPDVVVGEVASNVALSARPEGSVEPGEVKAETVSVTSTAAPTADATAAGIEESGLITYRETSLLVDEADKKSAVPNVGDIDTFTVLSVERFDGGKGAPFRVVGTFRGYSAAVRVGELAGLKREVQQRRIGRLKQNDAFPVEVISFEYDADHNVTIEGSERLAAQRRAVEALQKKGKFTAIVREDVGENAFAVFVTIPGGYRARVKVQRLKDKTREERDKRISTFKKGDTMVLELVDVARHERHAVLNLDCREVRDQEPARTAAQPKAAESTPVEQRPARSNHESEREARDGSEGDRKPRHHRRGRDEHEAKDVAEQPARRAPTRAGVDMTVSPAVAALRARVAAMAKNARKADGSGRSPLANRTNHAKSAQTAANREARAHDQQSAMSGKGGGGGAGGGNKGGGKK